ncbi:MAG: beta-galactosidase [Lachnospiraceae bacterium]|nr:beta-galactosidase [Lachnospiraceae bacterium]
MEKEIKEYSIDLTAVRRQQLRDLPKKHFSGKDPTGRELAFTNYYMTLEGKPFFGISGECHFARVSENQWEDTVLKMKAGGLNIISTYIFWIHHEETEGEFNFRGRRNVRKFVELCKKHGMYVILRIGPFNHGEVRNGGLPDWLYGKPFEVRSDNEGFLQKVESLYGAIAKEVKGLMFQDGGPVIAAQIDNEYMHAGAPWEMTTGISDEWVPAGSCGETYMKKLKAIAAGAGITPPFYTCTGWGGAAAPADEMLPLWGGYAYWPWMFYKNDYVHPATPEYIYRDNHNNAVPSTYNFEPSYQPESVPYACCEMGGGMANYYNYRFILPFESVDAMANVKLASGCNFLGYYMYRGGNNPRGEKIPYLNEHQCPKISYDYQAPIGEFGQIRPSFYRLRCIHYFTTDYREQLCDLVTVLPEGSQSIDPADGRSLRYAVRTDGKRGFVFINNFQDHATCSDKEDLTITLQLDGEQIRMEHIFLKEGENAILPFGMDVEGTTLSYATAQPLSKYREKDETTYVFIKHETMPAAFVFADGQKECFEKEESTSFVKECKNGRARFVVLSRADSLKFTRLQYQNETLAFLADTAACFDGQNIRMEEAGSETKELQVTSCGKNRYTIHLPELSEKCKDTILQIDYRGDIGSLYGSDGTLLSDNFSNEDLWEIGLRETELESGGEYTLYITPRKEDVVVDVSSTMAGRSEKYDKEYAALLSVKTREVYEKVIPLSGSIAQAEEILKEKGLVPVSSI